MAQNVLQTLCEQTDSKAEDWTGMEGPETGVGVEQWFVHKDGREAYTCNDQGDITVDVYLPLVTDRVQRESLPGAASMLPVTRPASPWPQDAVMFVTTDGTLQSYTPDSSPVVAAEPEKKD